MALRLTNDRVTYGTALWFGVLAGLAVTALLGLARWSGLIPFDLSLILGTWLGFSPGLEVWITGFLMHLLLSAIVAVIYATAFQVFHRASAIIGIAFAFVHWLISGLLMGLMPLMHPLMPEVVQAPGFFGINGGPMSAVVVLALHLVFGAMVGALCSDARERKSQPSFPSQPVTGVY